MVKRDGEGPVGAPSRSRVASAAAGPSGPGPPTPAGPVTPSGGDPRGGDLIDGDVIDGGLTDGTPPDGEFGGLERPFAAGGTMGRLMAGMDWAGTPLGPIRGWGASLRTSVGILLESRFPMVITWGPALAYLYNDGAIPILGRKHPAALGQPFRLIWPEIWDLMRPMIGQVMSGGGATWSELIALRPALPPAPIGTSTHSRFGVSSRYPRRRR